MVGSILAGSILAGSILAGSILAGSILAGSILAGSIMRNFEHRSSLTWIVSSRTTSQRLMISVRARFRVLLPVQSVPAM
jgi:hypothetical protein